MCEVVEIDQEQSLLEYLKKRLGWDEYLEICKVYGGSRVYIPRSPLSWERDEQIRAEYRAIVDSAHNPELVSIYQALARRFGLTESGIRYILFEK